MSDPFACPRDAREQHATDVMREFLLSNASPFRVFRMRPEGYALIVPSQRGARRLTVPGADEADFLFHGEPSTTGAELAEFIAHCIDSAGADHVRLPALPRDQATHLRTLLVSRRPDWQWDVALSAVSPVVVAEFQRTRILTGALKHAERTGIRLERAQTFDPQEFATVHAEQWGAHSRSSTFFLMLDRLFRAGCVDIFTARDTNSTLLAAHVDITGLRTRHFYYSVCRSPEGSGAGTALLGMSWNRFRESETEHVYSFGRGTERYKFQYATAVRTLFELRGFFVPTEHELDATAER
jgi:hypothetical protein